LDCLGQARWYVLTGPPGSGKTTLLESLARRGIQTVPEAARALLTDASTRGQSAKMTREDERGFQDRVLQLKLETERRCDVAQTTVFDRGIPDTLAYYRLHGWQPSPSLTEALSRANYAAAFMLEPLSTVASDPLRIESSQQRSLLSELLWATYRECEVPIVPVPAASLTQRVATVLERLPVDLP
jgi:predicted ATPase